MATPPPRAARTFKSAFFAKAARKAGIRDTELCRAIVQVMKGQVIALGGGVYKKRLNKNEHRSIILAKGGRHWFYTYLFAKKDRDNIEADELKEFRRLATLNAALTDPMLVTLIQDGALTEICHGDEAQV